MLYSRGSHLLVLVGLISGLLAAGAAAQNARLMFDFAPAPPGGANSSFPQQMLAWRNGVVFSADTPTHGRELYTYTDGVTHRITDIGPGPDDAFITRLTVLGDDVLFLAKHPTAGNQIFRFDGIDTVTQLTNLNASGGGLPAAMVFTPVPLPSGRIDIYFGFNDGIHGIEPWVIENIERPQVKLVQDLLPGPRPSGTGNPVFSGTTVFWMGETEDLNGNILGFEPIYMDVFSRNFTVHDIRTGFPSSFAAPMAAVSGGVLFAATNDANQRGIWFSDGTIGGTRPLVQLQLNVSDPAPAPGDFYEMPFSGQIYFTATTSSHGRELWTTNRTPQGTSLVADLIPGPTGSNPSFLTSAGNTLSFVANQLNNGRQVHTHPDRSTLSPRAVTDLRQQPNFLTSTERAGIEFIHDGTERVGPRRDRLFALNATTDESSRIQHFDTFGSRPSSAVTNPNSDRIFVVFEHPYFGIELFELVLPSRELRLIADLVVAPGHANPEFMTEAQAGPGEFVFVGFDDNGIQLGRVRGGRVTKTPIPSRPEEIAQVGSLTVLAGESPNGSGVELLAVDDILNQLREVIDLNPGAGSSNPRQFSTTTGGMLTFVADTPVVGTGIFETNGTAAGTRLVVDPVPGPDPFADVREYFRVFEDKVLAATNIPGQGVELLIVDRPGNVLEVVDLNPGPEGSGPTDFRRAGSFVVFSATDGQGGRELWITDCTVAGTKPLVDFIAGEGSGDPRELTSRGGTGSPFAPTGAPVVFSVDDGIHGRELWGTDGTVAGTQLLLDIRTGPEASNPFGFVSENGLVFFAADDGIHGLELWVTDGTTPGTRMVTDLAPGPDGGLAPAGFIDAIPGSGLVAFAAADATFREDLFVSDGTAAGTVAFGIRNVARSPRNITAVGDRIVFMGQTTSRGRELYEIDLVAFGASRVLSYGIGCPGQNRAIPAISVEGQPKTGTTFSLNVESARPNANALLALGIGRAATPLGGSCQLLIQHVLDAQAVTLDPSGSGRVDLPIPALGSLRGAHLNLQWFVIDPSAATGASTSRAVDATISR